MTTLTRAQQELTPALERIDRDARYVSDLLEIIETHGGWVGVEHEISLSRIEDWLGRAKERAKRIQEKEEVA